MSRSSAPLRFLSLVTVVVSSGLTGCGMSTLPSSADSAAMGPKVQGRAFGGQSPLVGAAVYLYAAGSSGYGGAGMSLLNPSAPGVSTDANGLGYVATTAGGSFTITGDYQCASSSTQLYLLALGGNPGLTGSVNNTGIGELLALGSCGNYTADSLVVINELSTVAGVTALQQFMTPGAVRMVNISTSATNAAGLANAFITAANLVSPSSPNANQTTPSGLGVVPYQAMNTLADAFGHLCEQ